MNLRWIKPEELVEHELQQLQEEGTETTAWKERWQALQAEYGGGIGLRLQAYKLLHELSGLPVPVDRIQQEPNDWHLIHALQPKSAAAREKLRLSEKELADRILGGWLGRAAGCLLGKPVEKHPRVVIRELLESNGTWPLHDYITAQGIPGALLRQYPWNRHSGRESLRENITCMPEDDDMNYPMLNLQVLETHGPHFTTAHIAEAWLSLLPVLSTFTAERVAYLNCLNGLDPPHTATVRNPYREWIGAQIRADLWGWVAPGNPGLAAALAWRDARLSHVRNGVYGAMFFAASLAASFTANDLTEAFARGLQQIPPESRLAHAVRFALALPQQESDWEHAVDRLYAQFGALHWVHSLNNAALVVAAALYGQGDYERSICNVVMAGWDTDSNGATTGALLGTLLGAHRLPAKWIAPLHNRIRSSMKDFDNSTFSDLAQRTMLQVMR